jgi:hypothetical protein
MNFKGTQIRTGRIPSLDSLAASVTASHWPTSLGYIVVRVQDRQHAGGFRLQYWRVVLHAGGKLRYRNLLGGSVDNLPTPKQRRDAVAVMGSDWSDCQDRLKLALKRDGWLRVIPSPDTTRERIGFWQPVPELRRTVRTLKRRKGRAA